MPDQGAAAEPTETRSCGRCGTSVTVPAGNAPLGWSIETEGRRVTYLCADCVRANVRSIEAKLPEEYW